MSAATSADEATSSPSAFFVGLSIATIGAGVAVLPAALGAGTSIATAWLALWGAAALVVGPAGGALRLARPLSRLGWTVPFGLVLAGAPLSIFARVLKVATHHRPLGGATFAFVALGVVAGSVALAARLLAWSETSQKGRLLAAAVGLGAAGLLLLLGMPLLAPELRGAALGALLTLAAMLAGAFAPIGALERLSIRIGPILWLIVVVVGVGVLGKQLLAILHLG